MNNIFLTSQASEVLGKIKTLLPESASGGRVVFIPTAAKPYASAPWLEKDRASLVELGFSVRDFDIEGVSRSDVRKNLASADIIFVGGGNTFYLLEKAKKSGFLEITRELVSNGAVYIGSSAGSVLATPNIAYVERFDDPTLANLKDSEALGLVSFRILPHAGNPTYEEIQAAVLAEHQSEDSPILLVKDTEFLLGNGDLWGAGNP